jgi:ATP-dependent DNA helicase RecG
LGGDITVKLSALPVGIKVGANVGINVGSNVGIKAGVNETQQKLINLLEQNPRMTAQQLSDQIGISKRRIESNIKSLKELKLIERKGATRNGYWVTKDF